MPYPIGTLSRDAAVARLQANSATRVQYADPLVPLDCGSWQSCWLGGGKTCGGAHRWLITVAGASVPPNAVFRVDPSFDNETASDAPVKVKVAVFGGTFNPPHFGHVASVVYLRKQGYRIIVVPSAGHEFKPETAETYIERKRLAKLAFSDMEPIEDFVEREDPRRALLVLRIARQMYLDAEIAFAIGPDIDPSTWTGYSDIIAEGFTFVRLPEHGENFRSTRIREFIADGNMAELVRMVPMHVLVEIIPGLREQLDARKVRSHVHVADAPQMLPTVQRRKGWSDHDLTGP